jgi:hypothetical protein
MKLFALLFAAAGATSAMADSSRGLASLAEKWNITDPAFNYEGLAFDLDYGCSDFVVEGMAGYSIWDEDCKDGGVSVANTVLTGTLDPIVGAQGDGGGDRTIKVSIEVQPEQITSDTNIYEELTGPGGELTAVVTFCVRFDLSTTGGSPIEVNFHETLVTLNVQLTDGFSIDNIAVEPRDKLVKTANQVYELEAFQCNLSMEELSATQQAVTRNQGASIRVCVRPNADARPDGIKMREVQSLTYSREDPAASQIAVADGAAANNGLSDLTCVAGSDVCMVETILVAEFYSVAGVVSGSGIGSMQFGTRRLRSGSRATQAEDEAGSSEFDMEVETVATVDDTASGAAAAGASALLALFGVVALI